MPDAPEDVSPQARRFKRAEDDGIIATTRWIGHPAVRKHVEKWCIPVMVILAPAFGRLLADTQETVLFCWAVFGVSGVDSDFKPTNREWFSLDLYPHEKCHADRAARDFRKVVAKAAKDMRAAGAAVDPAWDGDLTVIATLMLAYGPSIPWDAPARELAEWVYPPASSAITPDGKGVISRRDVALDSECNAVAIRHGYEDSIAGPRTAAPYAGGQQRADGRQAQERAARLKALAEVKALYPDVTAGDLLQNWSTGAGHPAHLYRSLIARELGKTWNAVSSLKPSVRSLERDHAALGLRFQRKSTAN